MQDVLTKLQQLSAKMPVSIRLGIADKMSASFASGMIKPEDRQIVEDIFRILAQDVEVQVRKVLSEQLKSSALLPKDVALTLARDVAEVADPMLQYTPVFSDAEMVEILRSTAALSGQLAIASREVISGTLAEAIVEEGNAQVVSTLIHNKGVDFSDELVLNIAQKFPENLIILNQTIDRYPLPLALAEKMISMVAEELRRDIVGKTKLSPYVLEDALQVTTEWARIGLMTNVSEAELTSFVDHLYKEAKLTPSLLMRALINGHVRFFEAAMARRANVAKHNIRKLLSDPGPLGFRAAYKAATMPPGVADAVKVVFQLGWKMTREGKEIVPDFPKRLLERIMQGGFHHSVENMSFVTAIIGRNMGSTGLGI